jgi:tetratricopeptide (TPR) repeat protein
MLDAESAESDMLAGEALDEKKDITGAIQQFRAAIKVNPREPNVHFGLGYLLWTQTEYREAASEFQAELANDPDHIQSMLYLADSEIQQNQYEAAAPLLEKVLKQDSGVGLAHLDLGIVLAQAGRYDEALRELTAAAKLMPGDVNVHWRLARLYRSMGKMDEAKAEFAKASSLNKAADESLFNKIKNGQPRSAPAQQPAPPPEK